MKDISCTNHVEKPRSGNPPTRTIRQVGMGHGSLRDCQPSGFIPDHTCMFLEPVPPFAMPPGCANWESLYNAHSANVKTDAI